LINLLSIVEVGGYPDFSEVYRQNGCHVEQIKSLRKSISYIKSCYKKGQTIDVIVAEYNFQTQFRDRTSSIESLMAVIQPYPEIKVIAFLEDKHQENFKKVSSRFPIYKTLIFPIQESLLIETINQINAEVIKEDT